MSRLFMTSLYYSPNPLEGERNAYFDPEEIRGSAIDGRDPSQSVRRHSAGRRIRGKSIAGKHQSLRSSDADGGGGGLFNAERRRAARHWRQRRRWCQEKTHRLPISRRIRKIRTTQDSLLVPMLQLAKDTEDETESFRQESNHEASKITRCLYRESFV